MNIHETVCNTYKSAKKYSDTHKNGNRSPKRTDILNKGTTELISNTVISIDDYKIDAERKISCSRGGKFTVDIVLTPKKRSNPRINILIKSVESSYNKNRHNYLNNMVGEVQRVYGCEENKDSITIFINYIPEVIPTKNKKGEILTYEKPKLTDMSVPINRLSGGKAFVLDFSLSEDLSHVSNIKKMTEILNKIKQEI